MNLSTFPMLAVRCLLLAGLALSLVACGDAAPEDVPVVEASGTLKYKGKPLEGYEVFFTSPEGRRAHGVTDSQGHFTLGTNAPGDGAPVGTHSVYIAVVNEVPEAEPGREELGVQPTKKSILPKKYENPQTSGLTMEVPESGSDQLNLDL